MNSRSVNLNSQDLTDLDRIASELLNLGSDVPVWLFFGEMGVGKTTLIKVLCEKLGVENLVQSPTFSIVNEYISGQNRPIFHFDFYRLKKEEEAYDIGVEEYLYSGNYCFIEWPEKVQSLWPERFFEIKMNQNSNDSRVVEANIRE